MPEFICTEKNFWGPEKGHHQLWKPGMIYDGTKCPNKYFKPVNDVQDPKRSKKGAVHYMDKPKEEWTPDDMSLATKSQINEKFGLNIKKLKDIDKAKVIAAARKSASVIPRELT